MAVNSRQTQCSWIGVRFKPWRMWFIRTVRGEEPDWLHRVEDTETQQWQDEDGASFQVVSTEVQTRRGEAEDALRQVVAAAAADRINLQLANNRAADMIGLTHEELAERCLQEAFVERVISGHINTTMFLAHGLVRFDEAFEQNVAERWREVTATRRLMQAGFGAGMVLMALSTLCGYFKLDTATRGYYTARLQFATGGTILALAAAGLLAAKWWGPWM